MVSAGRVELELKFRAANPARFTRVLRRGLAIDVKKARENSRAFCLAPLSSVPERLDDGFDGLLGVAEQHHCVGPEEQLVLDAGVA
jgi:hypothetical protein